MTPVGFDPTISAGERSQIYALDRVATGTGFCIISRNETNTIHNRKDNKTVLIFVPTVSAKSGLPEGKSLCFVEYTEGQGWPKHVEIKFNTVLLYFMLYCVLCWFWC